MNLTVIRHRLLLARERIAATFLHVREKSNNYAEIISAQTARRPDFVYPCLIRLLILFTANIITSEALKYVFPFMRHSM
jgi:hypothetical protein